MVGTTSFHARGIGWPKLQDVALADGVLVRPHVNAVGTKGSRHCPLLGREGAEGGYVNSAGCTQAAHRFGFVAQ